MPIVLSTVGVGLGFNGPTLASIHAELEGVEPIDRTSIYKGTAGIVLATAAPEDRLAMTSSLLIALLIGLSVPVIGAGIALDQGAGTPDTVLLFGIVVGVGVLVSGWALLRRPSGGTQPSA